MNNNLINQYRTEIKKLKDTINKLNQCILELRNDSANKDQIMSNNLKIISNSKAELINKDIEIKDLKNKLINYENSKQYDDKYNTICVNFVSADGKLDYKIKCSKNDIFAKIEDELYKKYDEYRQTDNIFFVNGNKVLRFKTISENNIKDGDKIIFQISSNIIGLI